MKYEWHKRKRVTNVTTHGLDFVDAQEVLEGDCLIITDEREDYGEERFVAYGMLKGRLTVVVYTDRKDVVRIISFRKANSKEVEFYGQEIG